MATAQETLAGLPDDEFAAAFRSIMAEARDLGLRGFGGGCFAAAVGVKRAVFGEAGTLAAGLNAELWQRASHAIGHAAVEARGAYWDADGHPKQADDIESWGMLDPEDSDLTETFLEHGLAWTEEAANEAAIWVFDDEDEFLHAFDCGDEAEEAERIVNEAAEKWAADRSAGCPGVKV